MDKSVKRRFARLIKQLKGDQTQREFACKVGVSQATIWTWEHGEIKSEPKQRTLNRLAELKHWSLDELAAYLSGRELHSVTTPRILDEIRQLSKEELVHVFTVASETWQKLDSFSEFSITSASTIPVKSSPVDKRSIGLLSKAFKKEELNVSTNHLADLIQQETERLGIDEVSYARRVRLSVSVLRQIMSGSIPGNPQTKLGSLAANLTNPDTGIPFGDWQELAQYCGITETKSPSKEGQNNGYHTNGV